MQRGRLPWLLSLPLMASGCLGAHSLAYRLAGPAAADSGHGYLALAPLVLAIAVTVGAVAALASALAGRAQPGAPPWLFAPLPPLAFTLQEQLEHALEHGAPRPDAAVEPAFLLGLALQLPFALCALVLARSLLRAARAASGVLVRARAHAVRAPVALRPVVVVHVPRAPALASSQAGRAPPPRS